MRNILIEFNTKCERVHIKLNNQITVFRSVKPSLSNNIICDYHDKSYLIRFNIFEIKFSAVFMAIFAVHNSYSLLERREIYSFFSVPID